MVGWYTMKYNFQNIPISRVHFDKPWWCSCRLHHLISFSYKIIPLCIVNLKIDFVRLLLWLVCYPSYSKLTHYFLEFYKTWKLLWPEGRVGKALLVIFLLLLETEIITDFRLLETDCKKKWAQQIKILIWYGMWRKMCNSND